MRSLTILLLFSLGVLLFISRLQAATDPLSAEVIRIDPQRDGEWGLVSLHAQAQFRQRKFAEAAELARRALQIARHTQSDERIAANYYQLGNIYRDWGHCSEARANFSHAIVVREKQPAPNHKYLFNTIVSLLDTMCECEDYKAADKAFGVYQAKLQQYQSDAFDEAEWLSLRGLIFRARKNDVQAEIYYRRAMELREQTSGSPPLQIEEERANLAMVVDRQGRHAEALAQSEQVIAFLEQTGISRPAMLAGALNNAACALADLDRKQESERMFERAVSVAAEAFGEDTRFTARIMFNYARVLRENKESPAADVILKKGVAAYRRAVLRDNATVDVSDLR